MAWYNSFDDFRSDIPFAGGSHGTTVGSTASGLADSASATVNALKGAGQSDFHATPFKVDSRAFLDPNARIDKTALNAALAARQGVAAPMVDTSQGDAWRSQQMALANALTNQANGRGPSLAQGQMQHGIDQAIAAQHAEAASARGMSPAMAQRMAAQNIGQMQGQAAVDSGQLRMQEQLGAQQQLGGLLAGGRGQDQGNAFANQQSQAQSQAQLDQMTQFYVSQGLSIDQAQFAATQKLQELNSQNYNATIAANAGVAAGNAQAGASTTGALIGGVAALGGAVLASDRGLKTDISSGDDDARGFLGALRAYKFRYNGDSTSHLGIMAQDLERAPGGAGMVINTPRGKMIDVPQAVGRLLATSATLHERLMELEGKKQ